MHKLNTRHFALTTTTFIAVLYVVCAVLIFISPVKTLSFFNQFVHGIDLTRLAKTPNLQDTIIGGFLSIVVAGLLAALFATLWNFFYQIMEGKQ